jgi:hypothetical protein
MSELYPPQAQWQPVSEEERRSVREQLERVLASPLFRNSKRYPALLRFVVEQSLEGNEDRLKERLLGIHVFHREPDYDTNQDPIVRLTAGEVRKRIAQYYQQPEHKSELRIYLNSGSYVPHFTLVDEPHFAPASQRDYLSIPLSIPNAGPEYAVAQASQRSDLDAAATERERSQSATPNRRLWFWAGVAIVSVVAAWLLFHRAISSPQYDREVIWLPILKDPGSVLFVLPDLSQAQSAARFRQDDQTNLHDHLLQGRIVDFGDSVAMSRLATYLTREKKGFDVQLSSEVSYTRLQEGPAIFIGGLDNAWTMRVLEPLRFYMERRDSTLVYEIVDRKQPEGRQWSLDLAKPFATVTADYAIVASVFDKTTGRPILIVAGLGANGTIAAANFLEDPRYTVQLEKAIPTGWKGGNMELVIQTQVIDDKAGPPQLIAQTFW